MGRTRLIRANDESPIVQPLRQILLVVTGPVVILAEELARIDEIEAAFLYGSFAARLLGDAGPAPHDIDLMVLGDPDVDAVHEACTRAESAVRRPINPTILTLEEFAATSGFLDTVRSSSAVAVIGELPCLQISRGRPRFSGTLKSVWISCPDPVSARVLRKRSPPTPPTAGWVRVPHGAVCNLRVG